jgi:hypothetical protein
VDAGKGETFLRMFPACRWRLNIVKTPKADQPALLALPAAGVPQEPLQASQSHVADEVGEDTRQPVGCR